MRRLATVAFAFAAAVLAARYIPAGAWLYWAAAALVSLAFLGFLFKAGLRLRLFLILPALAAGLLWSAAYRQFALAPPQQLEGTTAYVEAVVTGNPKTADYGSKVPVRILPNDNGVPCRPVTALLYIYGETCQAEAGSTIRFTARFRLADTMYGEETLAYFADGINPFAAGSAGLQLSFAATLGILLFTERLYTPADERFSRTLLYRFRPLRKFTRVLLGGAAAAPGALVFTVPLTALHFGIVSLIAPLANIIILYAVLLAFYASAAAVVLGFIYAPAGVLAALAAALPIRFIASVAGWLSGMPFASVYTRNTAIVVWLIFVYLALLTVWLCRIWLRRVRLRGLVVPCCAGIMLLCVSLVLTSVFGYRQTLTMTVLDVGQGQCVVIEDGAFTAVVDCGSLGKDAGAILTGYLQSAGKLRIDLLVLTHYHEDHAGDIPAILERLPVRAVALPDSSIDGGLLTETILSLADRKDIELIVVDEALSITAGGLGIRLYEPLGSAGENERGLAVLCQSGSYEALITGDMNAGSSRLSTCRISSCSLRAITAQSIPLRTNC